MKTQKKFETEMASNFQSIKRVDSGQLYKSAKGKVWALGCNLRFCF